MTVTATVWAFPFLKSWHDPADGNNSSNALRAGAGGIYGTGAVEDWGIKCSHCHIDDSKQQGGIQALVDVSPSWIDVGGEDGYLPGERYTFTVQMMGEHLINNENHNAMAMVIEDTSGMRAGEYFTDSGVDSMVCPTSAPPKSDTTLRTTYVYGDCHGVLPTEAMDLTSWTFDWVAPAAGTGEVTVYYGMVDGNSGGESSLGDDVTEGKLVLVEGS